MPWYQALLQFIAAMGGIGSVVAFYQARTAARATKADIDQKSAAAHIESARIALDQQKELNDDERKFRESMIAVIDQQQNRINSLMVEIGGLVKGQLERDKENHQLQIDNVGIRRDYDTLLDRLDRQAERIQQITVVQAQAEYWERQASAMLLELETKKADLKAAQIHLESAKAEAQQWQEQFVTMKNKVDQLSAEVDHLRKQLEDQDKLITELKKDRQPGGTT